ncbi:hypothetical protein HanRHA438_Chr05g0216481 [Helianthus annuus]|uniref:Uncharacterized protein n=1 Tax=Helianthus annuus TaxID=4232 RepID=A0A9K3IQU5_HELAN|nr:hypothetical protein HanXRQr2_Chr06g0248051 [Helianthus annuus]KAJ0873722.1 hypothetical protein HanPSC8_Chr11g0455741 [Helianthus annuus]KAJ0918316.1 hypothetical protein HanRHA438_Chr05g0216481 [Helianthus annuus]
MSQKMAISKSWRMLKRGCIFSRHTRYRLLAGCLQLKVIKKHYHERSSETNQQIVVIIVTNL